jgi:hypothetical protein
MKNSYGNYVVQKALKIAEGKNKIIMIETITKNLEKINDKKLINKWKMILNNSLGNHYSSNNENTNFNNNSYNSNSSKNKFNNNNNYSSRLAYSPNPSYNSSYNPQQFSSPQPMSSNFNGGINNYYGNNMRITKSFHNSPINILPNFNSNIFNIMSVSNNMNIYNNELNTDTGVKYPKSYNFNN